MSQKYRYFKLYHEARNDRKLATFTDSEFRVWFNLMCIASESEERGSMSADDPDLLALEASGGDTELLFKTVDKCVRLKMLDRGDQILTFIHFAERQIDFPSDSPEATRERKRKEREQKRDVTNVTPVTTVTNDVTLREERRGEEKRGEENRGEKPVITTSAKVAYPLLASFSEEMPSSSKRAILDGPPAELEATEKAIQRIKDICSTRPLEWREIIQDRMRREAGKLATADCPAHVLVVPLEWAATDAKKVKENPGDFDTTDPRDRAAQQECERLEIAAGKRKFTMPPGVKV